MIRANVIASLLLLVLPLKKLRKPETFHFGGLRYSETGQGSRTRLATLLGAVRRALSFFGAPCLFFTRLGVGWRHHRVLAHSTRQIAIPRNFLGGKTDNRDGRLGALATNRLGENTIGQHRSRSIPGRN